MENYAHGTDGLERTKEDFIPRKTRTNRIDCVAAEVKKKEDVKKLKKEEDIASRERVLLLKKNHCDEVIGLALRDEDEKSLLMKVKILRRVKKEKIMVLIMYVKIKQVEVTYKKIKYIL